MKLIIGGFVTILFAVLILLFHQYYTWLCVAMIILGAVMMFMGFRKK